MSINKLRIFKFCALYALFVKEKRSILHYFTFKPSIVCDHRLKIYYLTVNLTFYNTVLKVKSFNAAFNTEINKSTL